MPLLVGYDPVFEEHVSGVGHPERPERVDAAVNGIEDAHLDGEAVPFTPRLASAGELLRVHTPEHLALVSSTDGVGGSFDADTSAGPRSYRAALAAAGAGVDAVDRLRAGEANSAFLLTRPPGHHALADRAMGFCLFNSVAVTAAALVAAGERVLILDWDAHHGNGTEAIFYDAPEVLFISLHQYPLYPGTGSVRDLGVRAGLGTTINVPLPAATTGDAYRMVFDEIVTPAAEMFSPTWLLVSCGFDAHRDDPLTDLGLVANDFADLTARAMTLAAPGRRIFFLEGGYDLEAVRLGSGSVAARLVGADFRPERGPRVSVDETRSGPVAGVVSTLRRELDLIGRL